MTELTIICYIFHLVLTMYRNALRTFRLNVEEHRAGEAKFDLIKYNFRAVCLLSYLSRVMGHLVQFDSEESEETIGDHFMLGLDLQYLFRYCLVIHLNSIKDKGTIIRLPLLINIFSFP